VRYNGRVAISRDARGEINNHELMFTLYVGAQSLRATQESQRSCYSMLRYIYDSLHGHWPLSNQSYAASLPILSGTKITTANFRAFSPLLESGGDDERLVVELPKISIYSTNYKIQLGA
jgi:hypothetical protein